MKGNAQLFGGLAAVMIQLCRIASGLSSSLHFKRGNVFSALSVFCFSIGLSFWEWHEVKYLAKMIGGESSLFLLQFCVVVSLFLEYGLASTIKDFDDSEEAKGFSPETKVNFSSNGTTKKKPKSRSSTNL